MKKKNKKLISNIAVIAIVVLAVGVAATSGFFDFLFKKDMLTLHMYDEQGNEIGGLFSIVEGVEGVSYISYDVLVTNTGERAMDCSIVSASPTALSSSLPTTTQTVEPSATITWVGTQFETAPFESDTATRMEVEVECEYQGETLTKSAYKDVLIQEDPTLDFTVTIDGEGGTTEGGGDTEEDPGSETDPDLGVVMTCMYNPFVSRICMTFERTEDSSYYTYEEAGYCPEYIEYEGNTLLVLGCQIKEYNSDWGGWREPVVAPLTESGFISGEHFYARIATSADWAC